MDLPEYLLSLQQAELGLADSYARVAGSPSGGHSDRTLFLALANQGREHANALDALLERYGGPSGPMPGPAGTGPSPPDEGSRPTRFLQFQDLYLSACLVDVGWTVLMQAGRGLEDRDFVRVIDHCSSETGKQLAWIKTRIKHAASPTLLRPQLHAGHRRPPGRTALATGRPGGGP
ncbi:hypothetical protein [Arthrobacter sp. JSM 101049]|uniref:hypothetical protein n=1 Tax=Arthrobacter sp. JSM 101049 TaxID=929097 RepID=UPI0035619E41